MYKKTRDPEDKIEKSGWKHIWFEYTITMWQSCFKTLIDEHVWKIKNWTSLQKCR